VPGQRSSSTVPLSDAAAVPSARGRHLFGQQPPYASHDSLGPEPPDSSAGAADFGTRADSEETGLGTRADSGLPPGSGLPGGFGAASPASPAPVSRPDSYGPGSGYAADELGAAGEYFPPQSYGTAAGHVTEHYGAEAGHAVEPYGTEAYAPPGGYQPGDGYGTDGGYGYLAPDPYLSGQSFFPPDSYGSADPYDPPAAAGPVISRGSHAAPPAAAPTTSPEPAPHASGAQHAGDPLAGLPGTAANGMPAGYNPRDALAGGRGDPARLQEAAESTESLTPEFLLSGRRRAPSPGWRRVLYQASAGLIRVPESAAELRRRDMVNRIRTPVAGGHHRVAVLSLKGGVGKTTTTVGLGSTLASLRGDRVLAVDANPDRGTLSDKVRLESAATVRDLLNEREQIERYADVRAFTSQAPSRLEVLASDRDPTVSVAFSEEDYCEVSRVLEHYYSICLTDCGTGLLHSAMAGVLRLADQIVLVSSPSVDGARSASATLDWLAAHAYGDLVRGAVVVLSIVRPSSRSTVDLDRLEQHFAARCRAVTRIPYDTHLEEGAEVELDQLSRATADAYLELAAIVGDGLAWPRSTAQHGAAAGTARRDGGEA
jgi:MinD-like ATPase involved in chromosome partitioning or flagellar assembly